MKQRELIFTYMARATFVKKDIELLSGAYRVREFGFMPRKKWHTPLLLLAQGWFFMRYAWRADAIVAMFAGYHTLWAGIFAKLLGKPFLVIAGQTESICYPSFRYGNYHKPVYGFCTAVSLRMATHIAPVHKSLIYARNTYFPDDGEEQGMTHFVPGLRTPFTEIANGYDAALWPASTGKEPNTFITVAHIWNEARYVLKGIDLILAVAPIFPECSFVVVGMTWLPPIPIPSNVRIVGSTPNRELVGLFRTRTFYLQLSISEGHPNALCEAMLCNCIPICANTAAMPEIIQGTGFLLLKRDAGLLKELISTALAHPDKPALARAARERIAKQYPITLRQSRLLVLLQTLTSSKP